MSNGWSPPCSLDELRAAGVTPQLRSRLERFGMMRVAGWQPKRYQVMSPALGPDHMRELLQALSATERLAATELVLGGGYGAQVAVGDVVFVGGQRQTVVGVSGHAIFVVPESP